MLNTKIVLHLLDHQVSGIQYPLAENLSSLKLVWIMTGIPHIPLSFLQLTATVIYFDINLITASFGHITSTVTSHIIQQAGHLSPFNIITNFSRCVAFYVVLWS
jgi:hypothetical protein